MLSMPPAVASRAGICSIMVGCWSFHQCRQAAAHVRTCHSRAMRPAQPAAPAARAAHSQWPAAGAGGALRVSGLSLSGAAELQREEHGTWKS